MRDMISTEAQYTFIVAIIAYFAAIIQKRSWSKLGEGVTYKVRVLLYAKILEKNIGWFDLRDNGTSFLTNTLSQDTSTVNLAAGESVGPIVEGLFALMGGIIIALFFCWQVALICIFVVSLFVIGMIVQNNI